MPKENLTAILKSLHISLHIQKNLFIETLDFILFNIHTSKSKNVLSKLICLYYREIHTKLSNWYIFTLDLI
jgi:hypothetical protein